MTAPLFSGSRRAVLVHARKMWEAGLVVASAGNVSARIPGSGLIAITPASIPYEVMTEDQIAIVDLESGELREPGPRPSSELPTHRALYAARPDIGAVIHTHAPHVSVLAVLRHPLPPVLDEMIVYFGGTIEVAPYAFTGTDQLARNAAAALGDRAGVILANHGNVCVGPDLPRALQIALTMEATARVYVAALGIGSPVALPDDSLLSGRALYERRRV